MPFPVDKKYIEKTQNELGVIFPDKFVLKMIKENGGEIITDQDIWQLFPFFDLSDKKRISRTCNHIGHETMESRKWVGFPQTGIAIAENSFGDKLVLMPSDANQKQLQDIIFIWLHETGELVEIAKDFEKFANQNTN